MSLSNLRRQAHEALSRIVEVEITFRQIADSWTSNPKDNKLPKEELEHLSAETEKRLRQFRDGMGGLMEFELRYLVRIANSLSDLVTIRRALHEFTEGEVSDTSVTTFVHIDSPRLSKLRRHLFLIEQSPEKLAEFAQSLKAGLAAWKYQTFQKLVRSVPIKILDFLHERGTLIDERMREVAKRWLISELAAAISGDAQKTAAPPGTHGLLASLNDRIYFAVVQEGASKEEKRAMAHELRHLAKRLEEQGEHSPTCDTYDAERFQ